MINLRLIGIIRIRDVTIPKFEKSRCFTAQQGQRTNLMTTEPTKENSLIRGSLKITWIVTEDRWRNLTEKAYPEQTH
jgi:hypothetical protein